MSKRTVAEIEADITWTNSHVPADICMCGGVATHAVSDGGHVALSMRDYYLSELQAQLKEAKDAAN